MMRLVLCLFVLLSAAVADPLTYQVDFSSSTLTSCFIVCPPSPLPPGQNDAFSATFQLDSADLATDGSYDVTSTFASPRIFINPPLTDLTETGTIDAVVSGGKVTDLTASWSAEYFFDSMFEVLANLQAGSGDFRLTLAEKVIHTGTTGEGGTFTIAQAQTPEPGYLPLLCSLGLGGVVIRRRFARRAFTNPR